jgi:hypothetical protein
MVGESIKANNPLTPRLSGPLLFTTGIQVKSRRRHSSGILLTAIKKITCDFGALFVTAWDGEENLFANRSF